METKSCSKCKTIKYILEFGKHSSRKDGLRGCCKGKQKTAGGYVWEYL